MIRAAVPSDADAIVGLEAACFPSDAWGAAAVQDELAASRVLLVEEEDDLVGYVDVSVAADLADLLRVAVHPDHRRSGVASRLLAEAHAGASAAGAERILLEVAEPNTSAIALYAGAGYTEISRRRRYYRDGSDALVMEKVL